MLDEPYRWIEAIENRREYIEERLQTGSPVVGIAYEQGILSLTVTAGEPKVFEVYDRMAVSAVGHPADIDKLRMQIIDMAHVEGFSKSQADVTLHRLVNFGLTPLIKQAFDTVFSSPLIVKLLAVELGQARRPNQLYAINYDGETRIHQQHSVVTGSEEMDAELMEYLGKHMGAENPSLEEAIRTAMRTWALGRHLTRAEEFTEMPTEDDLWASVQEQLDQAQIDAAVLDAEASTSSKFRRLTEEEIKVCLM